MKRTSWIVALLVAGLMAAGCGKDDAKDGKDKKSGDGSKAGAAKVEKAPAPGKGGTAGTPKDAVLNFAKAFERGDKALALASVTASPKEMPVVEAMVDMTVGMKKFNDAMTKAYGKEAVEKLKGGMSSPFPSQAELASKIKITETGDKAEALMEGKAQPLRLVKVGGAWKVDMTAMMAQEPQMASEQGVKMLAAMAKSFDEVGKNIGKPGTTAESINEDMGKAMMAAMMAGMPAPAPDGGTAPKEDRKSTRLNSSH